MDLFSIEREEKRKGSSFSSGPHHGTGVYTYLLLETRGDENKTIRGCERTWGVQGNGSGRRDAGRPAIVFLQQECVYIYPVPEELMDRYLRDRVTIKFMQQQWLGSPRAQYITPFNSLSIPFHILLLFSKDTCRLLHHLYRSNKYEILIRVTLTRLYLIIVKHTI